MTRASANRTTGADGTRTSARDRVFGLDVLRATAIVMVVVTHFTVVAGKIFDFPVSRPMRIGGTYGVELFFVLSGFLIGTLLLDIVERRPDFRAWRIFMVRRWMRTIPLYVVWVAILLVFFPHNRSERALSYLTFTQNLAWPIPDWFGVSWTLSVEEWFYLLFSAVLVGLAAIWGRRTAPVACAIFIVIPAALRIAIAPEGGNLEATFRTIVIFRLDAIAYGVAAVWMCRTHAPFPKRWSAIALVLAIALLVPTYFMGLTFWPLKHSLIPLGLALLLPAANALKSAPPIVEIPVRWVSERSYAMYMVHLTIVAVAAQAVSDGRLAAWLSIPLALFATLALSDLSFRYFEKPILRHRPRQFGPVRVAATDGDAAVAQPSAAAP